MSDFKSRLYKKLKNKRLAIVLALLLLNIVLPGILIASTVYTFSAKEESVYTKKVSISPDFLPHEITNSRVALIEKEIADRKEIERKRVEREENVQRAKAILNRYNSVMEPYAEIIVRRAEECGGDYKVLLAIAGNESGFGRIPYKLYNPYGYLDGKQYSGWTESLEFLSCVISQRFLKPCNNDIACIVKTYGGHDTDKERWIFNITWFRDRI